MAHNHQVQHRPRKESKEVELKTEVQELRAQNQKLKRENARLRRENEKMVHRETRIEFAAQDPSIIEVPKDAIEGCPDGCSVELRRIPTPVNTIVVCPKCKWRKTE